MGQGFPVTNKHDLLNSTRQGRVNESAVKQAAPHHRNDDALKLASLRLMDGDCMGQFKPVHRIFGEPVDHAVKVYSIA